MSYVSSAISFLEHGAQFTVPGDLMGREVMVRLPWHPHGVKDVSSFPRVEWQCGGDFPRLLDSCLSFGYVYSCFLGRVHDGGQVLLLFPVDSLKKKKYTVYNILGTRILYWRCFQWVTLPLPLQTTQYPCSRLTLVFVDEVNPLVSASPRLSLKF